MRLWEVAETAASVCRYRKNNLHLLGNTMTEHKSPQLEKIEKIEYRRLLPRRIRRKGVGGYPYIMLPGFSGWLKNRRTWQTPRPIHVVLDAAPFLFAKIP